MSIFAVINVAGGSAGATAGEGWAAASAGAGLAGAGFATFLAGALDFLTGSAAGEGVAALGALLMIFFMAMRY
jgi:hypothetical protein